MHLARTAPSSLVLPGLDDPAQLRASRFEGASPALPSGYVFELIQDDAGFTALAQDWDSLLERSAVRTPFMRWDWVSLWWAEYAKHFELAVGVIRDATGTPQAIAPLVIGHELYGHRQFVRQIGFLGSLGNVMSEGMDFLVPSGEEASLTPLLCSVFASLKHRWDMIRLPMMAENSPNLPLIIAALKTQGLAPAIGRKHQSQMISLPLSWSELEHSHGINWRANLRRKWKKMETEHQARRSLINFGADQSDPMGLMLALHAGRHSAAESQFLHPSSASFHRALAKRWLPTGRSILPLIELDGRPVAIAYGFCDFDRLWCYQTGWNGGHAALSPGRVCMGWTVQCAIERGLREFDFLVGDEAYKLEWSNASRGLLDIEAFRPRSLRTAALQALLWLKRRKHPLRPEA